MGSRAVEMESARRTFLAAGHRPGDGAVRSVVLRSWERSHDNDVDPERIGARFLGHSEPVPLVVTSAADVFDEFVAADPGAGCSVALLDVAGVVRARRDCDDALGALLDALHLVPGYGYAERTVGTTAASIALHERADTAIDGAEHYHAQLMCLAEAAALVPDPLTGAPRGVVVVICHSGDRSALQLPLARMLAGRIADRVVGEPQRRARAILDRFTAADGPHGEWVLATDGDYVLTNGATRQLEVAEQRTLSDLVLASLVCATSPRSTSTCPRPAAPSCPPSPSTWPGTWWDACSPARRGPPPRARGGAQAGLARRPDDPPRLRRGSARRRRTRPRRGSHPGQPRAALAPTCGPATRWSRASGRVATTCSWASPGWGSGRCWSTGSARCTRQDVS